MGKYCPNCNARYDDTQKFCGNCGGELLDEPKTSETAEKESKRVSSKRKRGILIAAILLLCLAGVGLAWVMIYFSPQSRLDRMLENQDWDGAQEVFQSELQDNQGAIEKVEKTITEEAEKVKTDFVEKIISYDEAIKRMETIGKVDDSFREYIQIKEQIETLNSSRIAYEKAEALFAAQEYTDAAAQYKRVWEEDANYADAREKINLCVENYKSNLLAAAEEYVGKGDYDSAIQLLKSASSLLKDDGDLPALIVKYQKDEIRTAIDAYEQAGDFPGAIAYGEEHLSVINTDSELKIKWENCKNSYRQFILAQAQTAFEAEGYQAAISSINNGLSVLLGDAILQAEKEKYFTFAPVDLTSIVPYYKGDVDIFTDGATDIMGNHYSTGMRGYLSISDSANMRFDCYNIWDIGGRYNILTATGIILESDKGSRCEGSYKIYGDGILLYEKSNIGSQTKPYQIEIDITGVTDLKIEMYGEGNMSSSGIDSVLVDIMLQKTK